MRTDKEQFEKIAGDYEAHAGKMRARKRVWTIVIATVLVVAMVVSSVLVIPGLLKSGEDAPIAEAPKPSTNKTPAEAETPSEENAPEKGSEYFITDNGVKDKAGYDSDKDVHREDAFYGPISDASAYKTELEAGEPVPVVPGGTGMYTPTYTPCEDDPIIYDPEDPYVPGDNTNYQAGQLTGAEICDRNFYESFVKDLKEIISQDILCKINAFSRVKVTVKNGETPLAHVKVELKGEFGVIFTAVTDNKGEAFLFYNLDTDGDQPTEVVCTLAGETKSVSCVEDGFVKKEISVEMNGQNGQKKLDLMFMIDTTGSMGDELEYLKAEISDIIDRIANNGEFSVRTSVNFYRDKGDRYIVHATPFTTDVEEVLGYIGSEHSMGGGDYPEAVHTAFDNAVNGHTWDEDAEKLLFFVLDAPPHSENEVYESLKASVTTAAAKGIRVIPIVSSGSDNLTEYLMRTYAALTGGTYTFLTDHSGIGNSHADPNTDFQYEIEMLNNMIVRIAKEYLA